MRLPLPWLLLIPPSLANFIPPNQRCVTAVFTAYNYLTFDPSATVWDSRCQNPLEVTSIYAASSVYCNPGEQTAGLAQLNSFCHRFAHTGLLHRDQLADNLTDDAVRRMKVVEYGEIPRREPLNESVMISRVYFSRTFRTIDDWQYVGWKHDLYGYTCYMFWAAILLFGILNRLFHHFWKNRRATSQPWTSFQAVFRFIQTHLVAPAPRPFLGLTLPTRIDAIILGLFWFLNTVLSCVSYPTFEGNLYWPPVYKQILRYVADRTGILSFANLPLLWVFAGRNNIFLWATGWSFATFNAFHRHVACIATLQAVVHTILYLVIFIDGGSLWKKMQKPYLLWGTLAMIVMLLLLPMSLAWVRHRTYEVFLLVHIVLSVVALVGCFYHTIIFEELEYWNWLWPAVATWTVDRFLRVVRLVYCNLHVTLDSASIQRTRSSATYDESSNVVRLRVRPASLFQPTPGPYYFLYQPFRLSGWESHPFTLGAWSYGPDVPPGSPTPKTSTVDVAQVPLLSDASSDSDHADAPEPAAEPPALHLTFWIRPYDGWTRHLRDQCLLSPDRTTQATILLEGPYGDSFPLWHYESILFVVGGTGIAAAVPYIQEHLRRSEIGATRTRDLHLVWTSRQVSFMTGIASQELRQALARDDVRASCHATANSDPAGKDILFDLNVEMAMGRPDLASLVTTHVHEARLSDCSAAVLVCGPREMADETRTAVYGAMRQEYEVKYVEESFSW